MAIPIRERKVTIPEEILEQARKKDWPVELLEWAKQLGFPDLTLRWWLTASRLSPSQVHKMLERRQFLLTGTTHVREANWMDNEALSELFAHAPEVIGEYEVTVERSPYAFAQFRLQERPSLTVIDNQGVLLACSASSVRNTLIAGQRLTINYMSAFRVREELRGQGFTRMMLEWAGLWHRPFTHGAYYLIRSHNLGSDQWMENLYPDVIHTQQAREGEVHGLPILMHHFVAQRQENDWQSIRRARGSDIPVCISLINRTHHGLDLFCPYSEAFLTQRLDDFTWGPKPSWWPHIYSWDDYYVLERNGRVLACGGLWDRGAHMREHWRRKLDGSIQIMNPTALLDFGYAAGEEAAMADLIRYFSHLSATKERSSVAAPLQYLPAVTEQLRDVPQRIETRYLGWALIDSKQPLPLKRPYTDGVYW